MLFSAQYGIVSAPITVISSVQSSISLSCCSQLSTELCQPKLKFGILDRIGQDAIGCLTLLGNYACLSHNTHRNDNPSYNVIDVTHSIFLIFETNCEQIQCIQNVCINVQNLVVFGDVNMSSICFLTFPNRLLLYKLSHCQLSYKLSHCQLSHKQ